jgi:hypothetical protein
MVAGSGFEKILYLNERGGSACSNGNADLLVLAPKWHLAWEGRSEFYELIYWIQVCSKVLQYDSRYEFYELSYWIR